MLFKYFFFFFKILQALWREESKMNRLLFYTSIFIHENNRKKRYKVCDKTVKR